jgi:uracil-DNA glycosylase family 4
VDRIKLYPEVPKQAVELEAALSLDRTCARCPTCRGELASRCMAADGEPGGLLIVGEVPGMEDDRQHRPFTSVAGRMVRELVSALWKDPVVWDNAVKCAHSLVFPSEAVVARCRPYLATILQEAQPTRIVALGSRAMRGLLGRVVPVASVRRGYAYLSTGVPVFFAASPGPAVKNKHLRAQLRGDLEWILQPSPPIVSPLWRATARVVKTHEDALEAAKELRKAPWFSFDTETAGKPFAALQVLTAGLFPAGGMDGFVWSPEAMRAPGPREVLGALVADARVQKAGNNLKFDLTASSLELGVTAAGVRGDPRLMRKLADADVAADLDTMGELVGMGGHKAEMKGHLERAIAGVHRAVASQGDGQLSLLHMGNERGLMRDDVWDLMVSRPVEEPKAFAYALVQPEVLERYVARDALASRLLEEHCEAELAADVPALQRTWDVIVKPASEAIRQVEEWGIAVDRCAITNFHVYLKQKQEALTGKMMAWGKFDPRNPHSVGEHLFDVLKLHGGARTEKSGQWCTDAEVLEHVAKVNRHPLPPLVVEWKGYDKLISTYVVGMERYIRADGRVHPNFMLDGARTGRASCREPNAQNIPRDADSAEGKMARDCFVASPGCLLVQADFSQLEIRVAAALSGDEAMRSIFLEGADFHQRTAEFIAPIVWKIRPDQVTKKHRSGAKSFVFGLIYGMSDEGVAARAGCSLEDAKRIREAVLGKFHKLATWIQRRVAYTKKYGCSWTWWDGQEARRRPLTDIASPDSGVASEAERCAFNTPVQGTGSDFCLMSLTECVNWIREDAVPAKVVLAVHDSLLGDVQRDAVAEVAWQMRRIMTSWPCAGVPLVVDIDVGPAWGSMQRYHVEVSV